MDDMQLAISPCVPIGIFSRLRGFLRGAETGTTTKFKNTGHTDIDFYVELGGYLQVVSARNDVSFSFVPGYVRRAVCHTCRERETIFNMFAIRPGEVEHVLFRRSIWKPERIQLNRVISASQVPDVRDGFCVCHRVLLVSLVVYSNTDQRTALLSSFWV